MLARSSTVASALDRDALLLVSPHASPAHRELARRFPGAVGARPFQLGTGAGAALGEILVDRPPRVVAVPLAILANDPALEELDGLLRWAKSRWPETTFLRSDPLGTVEHAVGWASRRAREAIGRGNGSPEPSALLVVGDGGKPAANAEVCMFARLLWENLELDLFDAAFVQGTRPTIAEGLERLSRLGAERIVVVSTSPLDDSEYGETLAMVEAERAAHAVVAEPMLAPAAAFAVARRRFEEAVDRWTRWGDDGLSAGHGHDHGTTCFNPATTSCRRAIKAVRPSNRRRWGPPP